MRQVVISFVTLVMCMAASNAAAGRIFGDIKMDGKPLPAGVLVTVALVPAGAPEAKGKPAVPADSTATDKFGSYKLTVKGEGKCVLTLVYDKQTLTLDVFSYKEATRYDLVLEKKEGKLTLRRK